MMANRLVERLPDIVGRVGNRPRKLHEGNKIVARREDGALPFKEL
jgi:hypothetical protein